MPVVLNTKKLGEEVLNLKQEVKTLRSVIIGFIGEDEEGRYNQEFVEEILNSAKEIPEFFFKDSETFLSQIKNP